MSKNNKTELLIQAAAVSDLRLIAAGASLTFEGAIPELELLHSSLNGVPLAYRSALDAKAGGMLAGIPDLFLPVARDGFHGFYIEMKAPKEKPTANQLRIHALLRAQGYRVEVYDDADTVVSEMVAYCLYSQDGHRPAME